MRIIIFKFCFSTRRAESSCPVLQVSVILDQWLNMFWEFDITLYRVQGAWHMFHCSKLKKIHQTESVFFWIYIYLNYLQKIKLFQNIYFPKTEAKEILSSWNSLSELWYVKVEIIFLSYLCLTHFNVNICLIYLIYSNKRLM